MINNKWQYLAWLVALAGGWWLLSGVMTSGGQTFVWSPWVWAKVLLSNDHLAWDEWALRQQMYASSGFGWHAAKDYVLMIVVGVWYVFGARLLAWVVSKKSVQLLQRHNLVFFLVPAVVWAIFGFNVMQAKGDLNTFNFFIIAGVAMNIVLGVNLAAWSQRKIGLVAAVVVLVLFLPRTGRNWYYYISETMSTSEKSSTFYSRERWSLLSQLRAATRWQDVVLVYPENQDLRHASVVPALAARKTYLSDQDILRTHTIDYSEKEARAGEVFRAAGGQGIIERARELGVSKIYVEAVDLMELARAHDGQAVVWPEEAVVASSEAGVIIDVER